MSWFDEAVARRQRTQHADELDKSRFVANSAEFTQRQQQEVALLTPLLTRLLSEYGEHVFGKSLLQKRFLVRLERPGKNLEKSWTWHWHLDSLVKGMNSVEVHPNFAFDGTIQGFLLLSAGKRVEVADADEAALKDALVSLYMQ
jgi:hypothetical protein